MRTEAYKTRLRFEPLEDRHMLSATTTIEAGTDVRTTPSGIVGTNLATWNAGLTSTQSTALFDASGLEDFRFPGGAESDSLHFDQANAQIPSFAEFIASHAGTTGTVTVDYGSGSPQEAAAELAYLQGSPTDTTPIAGWNTVGYWASLRAAAPLAKDDGLNFMRLNHAAPFSQIQYWEIGNEEYHTNEVDNHAKAHDPATYASFTASFISLASEITSKAGLPAVHVGIDSDDPTGASDNNWTKNVLTNLKADGVPASSNLFVSDHDYIDNDAIWASRGAAYESLLTSVYGSAGSSIQLRATEWNSNWDMDGVTSSITETQGEYVAISIGNLLASGYSGGDFWGWEDNTQDGGSLGTVGNGSGSTNYQPFPQYYTEELASKLAVPGGTVVTATATGGVDAWSALLPNGHLEIMLVNTSSSAATTDAVTVSGFSPASTATEWETTGGAIAQSTIAAGATTSVALPAYSVVVLDLPGTASTGGGTTGGGSGGSTPPPTTLSLAGSGSVSTFTPGGSAVAVDAGLKITSNAADLTKATVTITNYLTGDLLVFNNQNGITGSYAGGILTLTGSATPQQYQAALDSIKFSTTSKTTTTRTLSVMAMDGSLDSQAVAESLKVAAPVVVTPPVTPPTHHHHHRYY